MILPLVTLGLVVAFSLSSEVFLTGQNFRNIGIAAAALAIVALGQLIVVLTAGMDLSVGSIVALVSVVMALTAKNYGIVPAVLAAALTGGLAGLVNGFITTRLRVSPFVTTLAMMSVFSGLALSISSGVPIAGLPRELSSVTYDRIVGVPVPAIGAFLTMLVLQAVLSVTTFGKNIYAVGGNEEASRLSGLNVETTRLAAYALCGLAAALASIILTARVSSGQPTLGASLPLESLAAVVLGGASLSGGRGNAVGVAFGVAFISILSNGLNLLGVSSFTQMMIVGGALICAVAFDRARHGR